MNLQDIFSRVLHMSLTGSYIIVFVLLMRLALRNAPKVFSYVLWAAVLFRLLCPVSISSALSVLNFTPTVAAQPQGVVTTVEHPVILDIYMAGPLLPEEPEAEITHQAPEVTPSFPENRVDPAPVPDAVDQQAPAEPVRNPLRYAVTIWLLGMGVLFVYNIYAYLRLSAKTAGAVRLRKNIYLGDHIPTPFVKGLIRPKIYLPSTLAEAARKYIIAHERCHIKRRDPLWKVLGYIALCIHWFNPLVWLAFILSAKDMEMSCDEAVIGMYGPKIRAEYAASLLRLATPHRFIALTPLAFGEGDTKGRVMNMAKWKKPGFWAMLCAAIVCIAVLAACTTNPSETKQQAESAPTETMLQISENEAEQLCSDALEQLKSAESYYIVYDYPNHYNSEIRENMEYRRHGNNLLIDCPDGAAIIGSNVYFDGVYADFLGDYWVKEDHTTDRDANEWLKKWSMEGKQISEIQISGNTVTFQATWPYEMDPAGEFRGSYTYILNNDRSLNSIQREYILYVEDGETAPVTDSITILKEDPQATYAAIKAVADQCITQAELEEIRYQNKLVTEIPSNKTAYDQDFALGSSQMRWLFLNEEFSLAIGTENPSTTGVTVFHTEADGTAEKLTANENFWLEKLVDGKWVYVDEQIKETRDQERSVSVSWYQRDRYTLDWSDSYGRLEEGFYRVGRYYTVKIPGVGSDTQVCYAKFRIYDERQDELITKCRNALTAMWEDERFHLRIFERPRSSEYKAFYDEIWKYGGNYLNRREVLSNDDITVVSGSMLRDGTGYSLRWMEGDMTKPLSNWSVLDFVDKDHFHLWLINFELYDSKIVGATQDGNTITAWMQAEYDTRFDTETMSFTFDEDGNLRSIVRTFIQKDGSSEVVASLEVLDTPAEEIKALINSQDVSKPPVFSWEEDKAKYPNAKTSGFVNNKSFPVKSMEDALYLADKECTMPPIDAIGGDRYNIVEIAYDPDAGIWRVLLKFSQNVEGDQIIYINDDGITVMVVTT